LGGLSIHEAKKIGRDLRLSLFRLTILTNYLAAFLATFFATGAGVAAATFLTGAFFTATFLAGAFLAGAVFFAGAGLAVALAGAGFFAAGLPVGFFAAGIGYPPFHSAVAEDKKLISIQFA
jgi:hypothetical protein